MSNLVAASVTYTVKNQRRMGNSKVQNRVQLAFGNGSLNYPVGGIPIITGNCGCPNVIESMTIVDYGSSGYDFNFNSANVTLQLYGGSPHNHQLLLKNGAQVSAANNSIMGAASNKLGANTGSDIIIAGTTSTTATLGGIVTDQAGLSITELTNAATPAALTLIVEIIGW